MSTMKHTPGPWEVDGHNIFARGRGIIATIPLPQKGGTFDCAENKSLICAAPELLEALKLYVAYRRSGEAGSASKKAQNMRAEMNDAIESAIAKAEGRATECKSESGLPTPRTP